MTENPARYALALTLAAAMGCSPVVLEQVTRKPSQLDKEMIRYRESCYLDELPPSHTPARQAVPNRSGRARKTQGRQTDR